jgi:hypothetical protein
MSAAGSIPNSPLFSSTSRPDVSRRQFGSPSTVRVNSPLMRYTAQVIQMARKLHRQLGLRLDYAQAESGHRSWRRPGLRQRLR